MIIYKISSNIKYNDFIKTFPEKEGLKCTKRKVEDSGEYLVTFGKFKGELKYDKEEQDWIKLNDDVMIGKYKDTDFDPEFYIKDKVQGEELITENELKLIIPVLADLPRNFKYNEDGELVFEARKRDEQILKLGEKFADYFIYKKEPYGEVTDETDMSKYFKEMLNDICVILNYNYRFNVDELLIYGVINMADFSNIIFKFLSLEKINEVVDDFKKKE